MDNFCVNKSVDYKDKSGFSPLEKPLCSEPSPAMLTQSQASSSHTLLRKSGFSLAETMVVLVIVAILMAAAAPLVAKKMSNDSKRLISTDSTGRNVYVAAGETQVLNVGSNNRQDLKLKVNGNTEMNGDLKVVNKPESGDAVNMIFSADGIKTEKTTGATKTVNTLFQINPTTRETNIEIAIPDYSKKTTGTAGTLMKAPANGFVFVSNSIKGFEVITDSCTGTTPSGSDNSAINLTVYQEQTTLSGNVVNVATKLPLLVPVSKDTCYKCTNGNISINGTTITGGQSASYYDNKCYFIPLAKARTTIISD